MTRTIGPPTAADVRAARGGLRARRGDEDRPRCTEGRDDSGRARLRLPGDRHGLPERSRCDPWPRTGGWRATSWAGRAYFGENASGQIVGELEGCPSSMSRKYCSWKVRSFQSASPNQRVKRRDASEIRRRGVAAIRDSFTARAPGFRIGMRLRLARRPEDGKRSLVPNFEGPVGEEPWFSCPSRPGRSKVTISWICSAGSGGTDGG